MDNGAKNTGLSATAIKYIAALAMLIDHVAWVFVPIESVTAQIMHFIGRLTAPVMCYFVAEGYYKTRNIARYTMRLAIFAALSHLPFVFMATGEAPIQFIGGFSLSESIFYETSVIFTLLSGLLALIVWKNEKFPLLLKYLIIFILAILSFYGDWNVIGFLWVFFFGMDHENRQKQFLAYYIVALACIVLIFDPSQLLSEYWYYSGVWVLGVLFAPLLIALYNGERGSGGKFGKWFFYIFYPAHMLIISIISYLIK